ncbi:MAG: hypothetical protein EOM22_12465 [Gammaproteobacteria bacterium]|nr:hypothetical protein [Gammaproteobacteria bacterium]
MNCYLSPHAAQAAAHQRELDRLDAREIAREQFALDAFEALRLIAQPLEDAIHSSLECRLEKILLDASDIIADQKIRQLEESRH